MNLNHAAVRIETDGGRATAVVAHDLISNLERRYRGRAIVLSAGTIESAKTRTAQRSGGRQRLDRTCHHRSCDPLHPLRRARRFGLLDAGAAAKLMVRHASGGLASEQPHTDDHRWISILELGTDFNQGRFVDPDILSEHLAVRGATMLCEMVFLFSCPLQSDNRVTHSGLSFVRPTVSMQECPITEQEWAEIESVKQRVLTEVGGIPLAGNDLVADRGGLGGVAHEVGTLRMGTDEGDQYRDGVVDPGLRMLAYDNLYVCDLSVFPTSPAANPTLTLAALALRLARRLRATL